MNRRQPCFCGSKKSYEMCCGFCLSGKGTAGTPETVMRSRYSAFLTKNSDYLIKTHHPSKRTADEAEVLERTIADTQWQGLIVLKASPIGPWESWTKSGTVEFAAFFDGGQIHETSRFVYENDQWYYLDGQMHAPLKIGRNSPCWCGSGKKVKKCHGR